MGLHIDRTRKPRIVRGVGGNVVLTPSKAGPQGVPGPTGPGGGTDADVADKVTNGTATKAALDAAYTPKARTLAGLDLSANRSASDLATALATPLNAAYAPQRRSAFANLAAALDTDVESVAVNLMGDSTANETTEWFYLLAQDLAALNPAYTVRHYLWNATNQDYDAPTTIQTGTAGDCYINTGSGAYGQFPYGGTGKVNVTGDLDVQVEATATDWTPAAISTLAADFGNAGQRGWVFQVRTDGKLFFYWTADGSTSLGFLQSTAAVPFADGVKGFCRVTFDVNNGSGGATATFYTSTDGSTWTQLGTPVVYGTSTTSIFATGYPYEVGGRTAGAEPFTGKIHSVRILNGFGGDSVVPRWPDLWALGGTATLTGAPILAFFNGSESGQDVNYLSLSTRQPLISPTGVNTALVLLSCSHNDIKGDKRGKGYLTTWDAWATSLRSRHPYAGLCLTTQNPETSPAPDMRGHAVRRRMLMAWADANRVDVVDAYKAFLDDSRGLAVLVNSSDGVHPTSAGSGVWRDAIKRRLLAA